MGDGRRMYKLGVQKAEAGDTAGAMAAFDAAIASGEKSVRPAAGFILGMMLSDLGDEARAIDAFQVAHAGGNRTASHNLGILLAKAGRLTEAKAAFEAARRSRDKEIVRQASLHLARVEARIGYQQTVAEFGEQVAPWASVRLGVFLSGQLNDGPGAKKEFEFAAASSHPEAAPVASYNLGLLLEFEAGDLPAARAAYQAAADSGHPRVAPAAWLKLGKLLETMHEPAAARAAYAKAGTSQAPQQGVRLGRGAEPLSGDFFQLLDVTLDSR